MPIIWPCTLHRPVFPERSATADSNQAPLRHTKDLTYRCFLPDLTGFISFCRVRPDLQRRLLRPDSRKSASNKELNLAIAGCKLQGTATSPSSTAINLTDEVHLFYHIIIKIQSLFYADISTFTKTTVDNYIVDCLKLPTNRPRSDTIR